MSNIAWFDRGGPAGESDLGGKNAALRALTVAGLPVPVGFAVTSVAFRNALRSAGVMERLADTVASSGPAGSGALSVAAASARELVRRSGMPEWLRAELDQAYQTLSERCGEPDVPVAIRSSATSEDGPERSSAGAHDTRLWVRSAGQVVRQVLECWVSLYTERAVAYRHAFRQREETMAMSVGVQRMVRPLVSGVAFTLDPRDGDCSVVAIEASWGFGEVVVAGAVTPDTYLVDKVTGRVVQHSTSRKPVEYRLNADSSAVVEMTVEPARQCRPCLTDNQARAVAGLACRAERLFGRPQDIEWAMEAPRTGQPGLWLLQSRPETAWSRSRERVEGHAAGLATAPAIRQPTGLVPETGDGAARCLTGHPASPGSAEGRARVILDAHGIGALERGEILVAPKTAPSWLAAFGRVSALVTDHGGVTSHAAITCREYGLPAVTGTEVGTAEIVTGQWLRVDGTNGRVVILGDSGTRR